MVVFTFCYRLLVVCLTRGEASASERRSVPKQQTGSGGTTLSRTAVRATRGCASGTGRDCISAVNRRCTPDGFAGLILPRQPFPAPSSLSPPTPSTLPLTQFRCLLKACPFHSATSTAHTGYSLFNAFSDHSPKASPFTSPLLAAFGWPHTFTLSRCIHLDGCMPYGFGHPRVSFNPVHIAVCIVFLRTTHLCPPVSFPSPSPWPPSLVPRTAVFITGPPRTDRD